MPSPISYYSMFNFLTNVAIDKITNISKAIANTLWSYPDMFVIVGVSGIAYNYVPIGKSIIYGDIAGIAYQSLKLVKESYTRPRNNWSQIHSGKYLYHGIVSILAQLTGISLCILELFGYGLYRNLYVLYLFLSFNMYITSIPLLLDTPFYKWKIIDKIKSGNQTDGFQITFFQMLYASIAIIICSLYYAFPNIYTYNIQLFTNH